MSKETKINELAQRLDAEDYKCIEVQNQQLTAIEDVQRETLARLPRLEAKIEEYEKQRAEVAFEDLLRADDEASVKYTKIAESICTAYKEIKKITGIPEVCDKRMSLVRGAIRAVEKRLKYRERYLVRREEIEGFVLEGEKDSACYHSPDLIELSRLSGMERDADKFLAELGIEVAA